MEFVLLTLFVVYSIQTVTTSDVVHSTFLDADNNYHLAWNFNDSSITFQLEVRTTGYIGFGFSPTGKMEGSDIVIGWVNDTTGVPTLTDRHATGRSVPEVDEKQDYKLIFGSQNGTHTILRFIRPLDLCNKEDRPITTDTIRLIWAYNPQDPDLTGRPSYHGEKRGTKSLYLLDFQTEEPPLPSETSEIDFLMSNVAIPSDQDTTYWCQPFQVPKFDRKVHAIKVEPIITPGHESEVHHILVYGCFHPVNDSYTTGHECYTRNMPQDWWGCTGTMFAWAIGGGTFYYPEHAGFPLGHEGDPTMFLMEMHYDNPSLKKNLIDSSGLRVTVTPQLRTYDSGVIDMGVIVGDAQVIPPNVPSFRSDGHCFPECLIEAMGNQTDELKIFAATLHSHLLGRAMRLRHFRAGYEQKQIASDESYDFNFQEMVMLKEEVTILPGDHFIMECNYSSIGRRNITYGGLSTRHEMCLGFVLYYPKIALTNCDSSPTRPYMAEFLGATAEPWGIMTSPPEHAGKYWTQVMEETVDWNDKSVVRSFQEHISKEDVEGFQPQCTQGSIVYPINGKTMKLPKKLWTREAPKTCGVARSLGTDSLTLLGFLAVIGVILNFAN